MMFLPKYLIHLFELDSSIYEKYTKGDLIARISNDLNVVSGLATSFLQNVIYYFVTIVAALSVMITINPLLSLLSISFMPFAIFLLNNARKKKREYYKKHFEIYGEMTENVLESI